MKLPSISKHSATDWPNGPMARRLTTIQSAIKRFQVRPLVRSSFCRRELSFGVLEVLWWWPRGGRDFFGVVCDYVESCAVAMGTPLSSLKEPDISANST